MGMHLPDRELLLLSLCIAVLVALWAREYRTGQKEAERAGNHADAPTVLLGGIILALGGIAVAGLVGLLFRDFWLFAPVGVTLGIGQLARTGGWLVAGARRRRSHQAH
jgi:hypothetical protein